MWLMVRQLLRSRSAQPESQVPRGLDGNLLAPPPEDEELQQLQAEASLLTFQHSRCLCAVSWVAAGTADGLPRAAPQCVRIALQVGSLSERVLSYRATVPSFLSDQLQSQLSCCRPAYDDGDSGTTTSNVSASFAESLLMLMLVLLLQQPSRLQHQTLTLRGRRPTPAA